MCSASQEIPRILWTAEVHYRIHKSLSPAPNLRHINPALSHPIPLLEGIFWCYLPV